MLLEDVPGISGAVPFCKTSSGFPAGKPLSVEGAAVPGLEEEGRGGFHGADS